MCLVMGSYVIRHPDTLYYHAEAIQWFKKYPAVPGLVNLRVVLGFQSLWFASEAILNPDFLNPFPFYLSGAVLCWYFIFIFSKISFITTAQTGQESTNQIAWLLLLSYSMASWLQVRLTAWSPSPDFIVTLFILSAIYVFVKYDVLRAHMSALPLLLLFCFASFTIKLSAAAILVLVFFTVISFLTRREIKNAGIIILFGVVVISPVLIHNVIASGYPLYPSGFADFIHADWKLKESALVSLQHYITAYARFPVDAAVYEQSYRLPLSAWLPLWWDRLAIADKLLFSLAVIAPVIAIVFYRKGVSKWTTREWMLFAAVFFGCLVWFFNAPDPRFGTGFLIGLIYVSLSFLFGEGFFQVRKMTDLFSKVLAVFLFAGIILYTGYRFAVFFKPAQIIRPLGIDNFRYEEFDYNNIKMNIRSVEGQEKYLPLPVVPDKCQTFVPRGNTIEDGFKSH